MSIEATQDEAANAPSEEGFTIDTQKEYDELNRKTSEESYEPTEEELDAVLEWESTGRHRALEESETSEVEEGASEEPLAEENPETENLSDSEDEYGEQGSEEQEDRVGNVLDPKGLSEDQSNTWSEVAELLGAKSLADIPNKAKELHRNVTSKGGNWGRERKNMEQTINNQESLVQGLIRGDEAALDFAKRTYPNLMRPSSEGNSAPAKKANMPDLSREEALDPAMYDQMQAVIQQNKELQGQLGSVLNKQTDWDNQRVADQAHWELVKETVQVAQKYPAEYLPKTGDISKMVSEYYSSGKVDPRIQPLASLLETSSSKNISDLDVAHAYMNYGKLKDSRAQDRIDAGKSARQDMINKPRTKGLGKSRGSASPNGAYTPITEGDLRRMSTGEKEMPNDWFHPVTHEPIKAKIPKNAWPLFYGKQTET